jgi:hypothetical protein
MRKKELPIFLCEPVYQSIKNSQQQKQNYERKDTQTPPTTIVVADINDVDDENVGCSVVRGGREMVVVVGEEKDINDIDY